VDFLRPEEQELAVIGILANGKAADLKPVSALSPEDFCNRQARQIFTAAQALITQRQRVELATLDAELTRHCGAETTVALMQIVIQAAQSYTLQAWNLPQFVEQVREGAQRRRLVKIGEALSNAAADGQRDMTEVLSSAQAALRDCNTSKGGVVSALDACMLAYDAAYSQEKPICTGIGELDAILCGGLRRGELSILGARPAVGKSSVLLQIARHAAQQGKKVLFVSLEMSEQQIGTRILSANSGLNGGRLISGCRFTDAENDALARGFEASGNDGTVNLSLLVRPGLTIEELRQEVLGRDSMDMLVLDYIQLLHTKQRTHSDFERLGIVSRGLKQIALEADLPILTAAQVRRQGNSGGALRAPGLDELRGSGDLEQDADNVALIHRVESADDTVLQGKGYTARHVGLFEGAQMQGKQLLTIEVAKQRQGRTGRAWVVFDPARMRFTDPVVRDEERRTT